MFDIQAVAKFILEMSPNHSGNVPKNDKSLFLICFKFAFVLYLSKKKAKSFKRY